MACIVLVPVPSLAVEAADDARMAFEVRTLDDLDALIAWQSTIAWKLHEDSSEFGPDRWGKRVADYGESFVYTQSVAAELAALRQAALQQSPNGDTAALQSTFARASKVAARQLGQLNVLAAHFGGAIEAIAEQENALAPWLDRASAGERRRVRRVIDKRLASYHQSLTRQLESPDLAPPLEQLMNSAAPVLEAYNTERSRAARALAKDDDEHGRPLMNVEVHTPCEAPFPVPSGSNVPSLVQSDLAYPDYPDSARRFGFQGSVVLRARVSAGGCPEFIEVLGPLGYAPLDRSALDWATRLRFHPAVHKSEPVEATHEFAVTFRLHE